MKIINALIEQQFALNKFVQFLIDKKYDASKLLADDNFLSIVGYILEFLESEKIFIIVDHNGYSTYKQFSSSNQFIIECEAMQYNTLEQKYIVATIKAFNFIENPF